MFIFYVCLLYGERVVVKGEFEYVKCKSRKVNFPMVISSKMISGKWKFILVAIDYEGCIRFNSILKILGEISSKVLYQNLRELEEDQLICRFTDPEKNSTVSLSPVGKRKKIMPVIKSIYKYSIDDMIERDILIDSRAFYYYNPARRTSEGNSGSDARRGSDSGRKKKSAAFTKRQIRCTSAEKYIQKENRRGRASAQMSPALDSTRNQNRLKSGKTAAGGEVYGCLHPAVPKAEPSLESGRLLPV